ncbi:hypothetical protein J43TS3_13490 [Ornithinibacillus bavariensis]|uniref:Uncharacterized protein n=1 Tax=Ornithinibacillus bavariensis TaxID=545502 RepID=A0A919X8D8_9BACI|nr:hypothetical protein J43TS3_13490 [Ornithinibacillus bavariensis]
MLTDGKRENEKEYEEGMEADSFINANDNRGFYNAIGFDKSSE